ncbi:MAG: YncE family protein [Planctomycetota bacterium]
MKLISLRSFLPPSTLAAAATLAFAALTASGGAATAQSTLVPFAADVRDHVYDEQRGLLYITTDAGTLERYDISQQQLLAPWTIGTSLQGCDITPDGQYLYVCEGAISGGQGFIYRVDLDSGAVTDIAYDRDFGEGGAWDVAIANNGKGFVTTQYLGSG